MRDKVECTLCDTHVIQVLGNYNRIFQEGLTLF